MVGSYLLQANNPVTFYERTRTFIRNVDNCAGPKADSIYLEAAPPGIVTGFNVWSHSRQGRLQAGAQRAQGPSRRSSMGFRSRMGRSPLSRINVPRKMSEQTASEIRASKRPSPRYSLNALSQPASDNGAVDDELMEIRRCCPAETLMR